MAATVNVLLPTGRRQNVKVTANTRILQVIENVCSKMGCNPNEYNLKHHRSILDPQLSFRYANLPNNCKLELVKADKPRAESPVHIALQTESGERLQQEFAPSASLWDVLVHWESQPESPYAGKLTTPTQGGDTEKTVHPVCIYLRQEIVGEAWLRATSLKSLGLTGGKAIIRLLHRAVDLPAPPSAPPTKTTPTAQVQPSSQPSVSVSQDQATPGKGGRDDSDEPMEVQKSETHLNTGETKTRQEDSIEEAMHEEVSSTPKNERERETDPVVTPVVQPTSTKSTPSEPMDVGESTDTKQSGLESTSGSSGVGPGARPKQSQQRHGDVGQQQYDTPLSPEMEQQANILGAALAEAILKHRTEQQLAQLKQTWSVQPPSQPNFADFKFPEQPSGQAQPSSLQLESSQPLEPCDRQPLVFSLDEGFGDPSPAGQDVPDDFFEVTVDDVRKMMAEQQLQMSKEGEQPLQTRAMREANALKKVKQYSTVAVRVHFPDRLVLQGFFRPLEPVKALRDFVRGHLQDPSAAFYLYTTPPRCVLKDDSMSLFKAELFPAAVVHFGSETSRDHYLRSDLLSELTSFVKAKEEVVSAVHRSISHDESQSSGVQSVSLGATSGLSSGASTSQASTSSTGKQDPQGAAKRQASGESALSSGKVPKWFKMGKR